MDAFADPLVEGIVIMSSAQVGKTEIINNALAFYIDMDPGPMLVLQPTLEMADTWSKDRLAPMIRDCPRLAERVGDPKARDSGNSIRHKVFPGGHITMAGANSPASLASRPIRILACDEVDRYPASAGTEGDPISLAKKRTRTYWNRKSIETSTPTVKGASRIEASFEASTQERYHVPCPHCAERQPLEWDQVQWKDEDAASAAYVCAACGGLWTDVDRWASLQSGEWVPQRTGRPVRGFHLSELYSPWATLESMVQGYLEAKVLPETMKTWVNTTLGLPYDEEGEQSADPDVLMSRREEYDAPPDDAEIWTAGADVQRDRIEMERVAWSRTLESWSIDYTVIHGDPMISAGQPGSPWDELDEVLSLPVYTRGGKHLLRWGAAVDCNFLSDEVYRYVKARQGNRVYAVRGMAGMGKPGVISWSWSKGRRDLRANRCKVYSLGVDTLKGRLYSRLTIAEPGPGYCHFPARYDQAYFDQLTAEKAERSLRKGRPIIEWVQLQDRNEALDCRVYNMGVLEIRPPRWRKVIPVIHEQETKREEAEPRPVKRRARPRKGRFVKGWRNR